MIFTFVDRGRVLPISIGASKEVLKRAQVGEGDDHKPAMIELNMFNSPWNRKVVEEDKETIIVTIDPAKDGCGGE